MNERQFERLTAAEIRCEMNAKTICDLQQQVTEQEKRIIALETKPRQNVADLTAIIADGSEINAEVTCMLRRRIERLEAALERPLDATHETPSLQTYLDAKHLE